MRNQPIGTKELLDTIAKLDAVELDERSVLDDDGIAALIEISDMRDLIRFFVSGIRVGDRFTNVGPEEDSGPDGEARVTPPGSLWRVVDVANAPDSIGIVCDATGGWINPSLAELLDPAQFKPTEDQP